MDTMQVENPPALNQSLNQDQHASSVRPKLSLSSPPSQLDSFSKNHGCSWVFSTTVHPRRSSEKSIQPSQPSWHFGGIDDADSALPCAIQEPQDNIPKVPRSTSSMSYVGEVRVLGVAHLLWALLLVLADIVSDRHVGEKHEVDDGRQRNWQAVTGFSLPPGILTSVGIFLLPQVFSAWSAWKRAARPCQIRLFNAPFPMQSLGRSFCWSRHPPLPSSSPWKLGEETAASETLRTSSSSKIQEANTFVKWETFPANAQCAVCWIEIPPGC